MYLSGRKGPNKKFIVRVSIKFKQASLLNYGDHGTGNYCVVRVDTILNKIINTLFQWSDYYQSRHCKQRTIHFIWHHNVTEYCFSICNECMVAKIEWLYAATQAERSMVVFPWDSVVKKNQWFAIKTEHVKNNLAVL